VQERSKERKKEINAKIKKELSQIEKQRQVKEFEVPVSIAIGI
jgi:hypothetical protein